MQSSLHNPARLEVIFDDDHSVANAGLALVAMCSQMLGIEDAANEFVALGDRPGASRPGRKNHGTGVPNLNESCLPGTPVPIPTAGNAGGDLAA